MVLKPSQCLPSAALCALTRLFETSETMGGIKYILKKLLVQGFLGFPRINVCVPGTGQRLQSGQSQEYLISVCALATGVSFRAQWNQSVRSRAGNGSLNVREGWHELV